MTTDKSRSYINWLLVLLIVAVIAGGILTQRATKARKHDVDAIKIEISNMRSYHDPNGGAFINGKYYIYTDYTITNHSKSELDQIEVAVHYKDGNGKTITQVTSWFGSSGGNDELDLPCGQSVTKETYISDGGNDMNSGFVALYGHELSEFEISYEILTAYWEDGTRYSDGDLY